MSDASITFEVPGRPKTWKRAEGRKGGGRRKHPDTVAYQARLQMAALAAGGARFFAPKGVMLRLDIDVILTSYMGCPDTDNITKNVKDALQVPRKLRKGSPPAAALYFDDVQVAQDHCLRWLDREGRSFLRVKLTQLPAGADAWHRVHTMADKEAS